MARFFSGDDLVIATHNDGKLAEFRQMFGGRIKNMHSARSLNLPSPPETGTTFLENVTIKAVAAAKASGRIALADDSGLCVTALGGAPGVYSADWAEKPDGSRDFNFAMQRLLGELEGKSDRSAAFVSFIMLAFPDGHTEWVEGRAEGMIAQQPRGAGGHGYDPLFIPQGFDKTYAELGEEMKNKISHRALAFSKMMEKCFR